MTTIAAATTTITITTTTHLDVISKPVHFNARGTKWRTFRDVSTKIYVPKSSATAHISHRRCTTDVWERLLWTKSIRKAPPPQKVIARMNVRGQPWTRPSQVSSSERLGHGNEGSGWPGVAVLGTWYQQQTGYTTTVHLAGRLEHSVEVCIFRSPHSTFRSLKNSIHIKPVFICKLNVVRKTQDLLQRNR